MLTWASSGTNSQPPTWMKFEAEKVAAARKAAMIFPPAAKD
jgi:hypothetical protein